MRVEASLQHALFTQAAPAEAGLDILAVTLQSLPFLLCLLLTAFLAASGAALFALDTGVRNAVSSGTDRANLRIARLLEHPRRFLATLLILNTLARLGTAVTATVLFLVVLAPLGWPLAAMLTAIVFGVAAIMLVAGEFGPRWLGTRYAYPFSRFAAVILLPIHRLLHPLSRSLAKRLKHALRQAEAALPRRIMSDDLKALVALREADGTLEVEEGELISSFVEFGDTTVKEIMTSRLDVIGVPIQSTLFEAAEIIHESGHSRLPLYDEHLDNVRGILYAKDLLPYLRDPSPNDPLIDWGDLARTPMVVSLDMNLTDLLREFKARQTHIAIVVDDYGGTAGLVTMEDVLEEIVGDILDEHDQNEEAWCTQLDDHTYRIDARANLDELSAELDLEWDTERFDFETLGGLILDVAGEIPSPGDEVTYEALTMRIETVDNHRIGTVWVRLDPEATSEALVERRAS